MKTVTLFIIAMLFLASNAFIANNWKASRMNNKVYAAKSDKSIIAKTKLVELIASETDISKADVGKVLETFMGLVKSKVLGEGDEMRLKDFGTFKQKVSSARKGRNPKTGEELDIPARTFVAFSASDSLKLKDTN